MAPTATPPWQRIELAMPDGAPPVPVFFRAMPTAITPQFLAIQETISPGRPATCPLCRVAFQAGEWMTRAMSMQQLFPNCMLHTACVDWTHLDGIACHLYEDWQAAQQYAHWF